MPKDTSINRILLIGSGPIVIGQACEFDYSGTQACKALKEEGFEVVLINSNPATIMTDPQMADKTYVDPISADVVAEVCLKEKVDAILPTVGGQTALNVSMQLYEQDFFAKTGIRLLGASPQSIKKAEDRELFKQAMIRLGYDVPQGSFAYSVSEAISFVKQIGFPCIVRASYTLGGKGGGIAHNMEELQALVTTGIEVSRIGEVLVEESIIGWKEYELEVMRDNCDNAIIVCSIENIDPVGIHTGDSITVAPAQTLSDIDYQKLRDMSCSILREIGVETGGSNVQFAVNPQTGRVCVIEMNPRVSRSSALASKVTGFPIAKIAAKLAVGYSLDEINNDITLKTPSCFEPAIDYCVVKIPRFTFEKFPEAKDVLGVSMKSVGEIMSIGRTFQEALQKGLRGLEIGHVGLDNKFNYELIDSDKIESKLKIPNATRIFYIKYAFQKGYMVDQVVEWTHYAPWFIHEIKQLFDLEKHAFSFRGRVDELSYEDWLELKQYGFSDCQLASILEIEEMEVRSLRQSKGVTPVYKLVDTCAAEFEAYTPYYYSTYESENEVKPSDRKKIVILGGGPNRIGQGIEFDYCCCHAAFYLKDLGYETIMINSNPETVSTDYDTADRLYFEPITFEDVMNVIELEKPEGVIVQFGGQTPLNVSRQLVDAGVKILGTSIDSIEDAEDREKFSNLIDSLGLKQPPNGIARHFEEAHRIAETIGYPVLVRPSFVLGGRAMKIVYNRDDLEIFFKEASDVSERGEVLIDQFLEQAIEIDVDSLCDGENVFVASIMEHIEGAGIHSGDSACVFPPHTLSNTMVEKIKEWTTKLALALQVKGLINVQYAVKNDDLYVLEVNPRASRTVPFASKVSSNPLPGIASGLTVGQKLHDYDLIDFSQLSYVGVKESVLPFSRFSGVDITLGPEMKSTGEVIGIAYNFPEAFAKAQQSAFQPLPREGVIFISLNDRDKERMVPLAHRLDRMGFQIVSTPGTARVFRQYDIKVQSISRIDLGEVDIRQLFEEGKVSLIVNTPSGRKSLFDMRTIRSLAVLHDVPCITTFQGAQAAVDGIELLVRNQKWHISSLQDYYLQISKPSH